jgi:hypothetical protein
MDIDTVLGHKPIAHTREQVLAAFDATVAVAEAIRAAGRHGIPLGHLYAMLLGKCNLPSFDALVGTLIRTKLVEKRAYDLLVWVGPEIAS